MTQPIAARIARKWRLVLALLASFLMFRLPAVAQSTCVGDCNGDGQITVSELITGINMALEAVSPSSCSFDVNGDGAVTIDEYVVAYNNFLNSCPEGPPTLPTPAASSAVIQVGSVSGQPGQQVALPVAFVANGTGVAGIQNDVIFDPAIAGLPRSSACSIAPGLGGANLSTRVADCPAAAGCFPDSTGVQRLRAFVAPFGGAPTLPDGVIYNCSFTIDSSAAAGAYLLTCGLAWGSTPDGGKLAVTCIDGTLTIAAGPTRTLAPTATSTPTQPSMPTPTNTVPATWTFTPRPSSTHPPTPTMTRTVTGTPTPTVTLTPLPTATPVRLSGSIAYSGARGPVSASRPIRISVHADPSLNDDSVAEGRVTTNPGPFDFTVPAAGNYYLGYWLDVNDNEDADIGEPGEIYNNHLSVPGDPVAAPQSGVALDFGDTLIPGITGTITYTGDHGPVSESRKLRVQAYTDAGLTNQDNDDRVVANGGRYRLLTLDANPRYVLAFLDLNGNGQYDAGEPYEIYNEKATPPGDPIVGSAAPSDINFVFGDQAPRQRLTGTITYTGARAAVSSTTPILLFMFSAPTPGDNTDVDQAIVSTNGGAFALGAPTASNYYLAYVLDLNGDGDASVGEPAAIYNNKANFPGDPIAVPQSGVRLSFGDAVLLQGVAGRVRYTGNRGHVSHQNRIIVEAFTDPLLRFRSNSDEVETDGGQFDILTLDTNTYYLRAFFDVNGNSVFDLGEPFEVYNNKGSGQGADPIVAGGTQTAIDIIFGDQPPAAHLSGTITYAGARGPVSNTKPIVLSIIDSDVAEDSTAVVVNGGAFDLDVPAPGNYSFAYFLDVNNDGNPNVGEPFEIYNDHFTPPPFDTIAVPHAGVTLNFNDAGILSGIGGTVTYTGQQRTVSADSPLRVELFTDAGFTAQDNDSRLSTNGGRYDFITLNTDTYYVRAFVDVNGNGHLDAGEPFEIYSSKGSGPGDPVSAGPAQTAINLTFGDENLPTPTATPTFTVTFTPRVTQTPTPTRGLVTCGGDCDGNGSVAVNEIVTMVNIALGNSPISLCRGGDIDSNQEIAINEIILAVNNALNGCGT